jgi:hypothetical protein
MSEIPQFVRLVYPWWKFWRGKWNSLAGLRMETDEEFRKRINDWIKKSVNKK